MQFNKLYLRIAFVFLSSLTLNTSLFAHSPTVSTTVIMKGEEGMWTLQIRAALTAFEQEVHTRYGNDSYKTPEAFNALVLKILAEDFELNYNGDVIKLENSQVKLGHETIVFSEFKNSESINFMDVKNSIFKNIFNSKNTVFVVLDKVNKNEFILNKENDFQANLKFENGKIMNDSKANVVSWLLPLFGLLALVGLGLVLFKRKSKIITQ